MNLVLYFYIHFLLLAVVLIKIHVLHLQPLTSEDYFWDNKATTKIILSDQRLKPLRDCLQVVCIVFHFPQHPFNSLSIRHFRQLSVLFACSSTDRDVSKYTRNARSVRKSWKSIDRVKCLRISSFYKYQWRL